MEISIISFSFLVLINWLNSLYQQFNQERTWEVPGPGFWNMLIQVELFIDSLSWRSLFSETSLWRLILSECFGWKHYIVKEASKNRQNPVKSDRTVANRTKPSKNEDTFKYRTQLFKIARSDRSFRNQAESFYLGLKCSKPDVTVQTWTKPS